MSSKHSEIATNLDRNGSPTMTMRTNTKHQRRKWKANSMIPKPRKKREPVVTDWLLEKRIKNEEKGLNDSQSRNYHRNPVEWKTLVEKMEHKDKIGFLLEKAKQMEEKAVMMDRHNKFVDFNDKINEQCDDLLIDALKARLAALTDTQE